ncbi:FRG domain-containing protein [Moraxella marmotae]|uniref:FRG domain-containing protein n=1 Tax=Moraxella marmotae TaxID=3344520 RepID=UPI0035F23E2A
MSNNEPLHNYSNLKVIDVERSLFEQDFQKEICNDPIFVPFNCIKVDTMEQLYFLFKEIFNLEKEGTEFLYRGHANSDWLLESTLERAVKNNNILLGRVENQIFNSFKKNLRGRLIDQSILNASYSTERNREIWAIGRHYDLKTPLIDWSLSIYVALFMAHSEPRKAKDISAYSAIFMVDKGVFEVGEMYVNPYFFTSQTDYYGRITAQKGFLSHYNIRQSIQKALEKEPNYALKIYIKNNLRNDILKYLKHIGIDYTTMYPDLQGVIKFVNNELEEMLIQSTQSSS